MYASIESWQDAVSLHTSGHYHQAVVCYQHTADDISARLFYNMACAHIRLGDLHAAKQSLCDAVKRDRNLAVAYFQRGTINLDLTHHEEALRDFEMARMLLRGNQFINYTPLNLFATLHISQIFFNMALAVRLVNASGEAGLCGNMTGEVLFYLKEALRDVNGVDDVIRSRIETAIHMTKGGDDITTLQPMRFDADQLFRAPHDVIGNTPHPSLKGADISKKNPEFEFRRSVSLMRRGSKGIDSNFRRARSYNAAECRQRFNKKKILKPQKNNMINHGIEYKAYHGEETYDANPSNVPFKRRHAFRQRLSRISRFEQAISDSVLVKKPLAKEPSSKSMSSFHDAKKSVNRLENVETLYDVGEDKTKNSDCMQIYRPDIKVLNPQKSKLTTKNTDTDNGGNSIRSKATSVMSILPSYVNYSCTKTVPKRQVTSLVDLKPSKSTFSPFDSKENSSMSTLKSRLSKLRIEDNKKANTFPSYVTHDVSNAENCEDIMATPNLSDEIQTPRNDEHKAHLKEKSTSKDSKQGKTVVSARTSVKSLGIAICDCSSVVKYALSTALDVATVIVTPVAEKSAQSSKSQITQTRKPLKCIKINEPARVMHKRIKSTKTKRAPDPPKISDTLYAMADFAVAFAKGVPDESSMDNTDGYQEITPDYLEYSFEITELNEAHFNNERTYYNFKSVDDSKLDTDGSNFVTASEGCFDENHNVVDNEYVNIKPNYVNVQPEQKRDISSDDHTYENYSLKAKLFSNNSSKSNKDSNGEGEKISFSPAHTSSILREEPKIQFKPNTDNIVITNLTRNNTIKDTNVEVHQLSKLETNTQENSRHTLTDTLAPMENRRQQTAVSSTKTSRVKPPPSLSILSKKYNPLGFILGQSLNIAVGVVGNHKYDDDNDDDESNYDSCLCDIEEEQSIEHHEIEGEMSDDAVDINKDHFEIRTMETRPCTESNSPSSDFVNVNTIADTANTLRAKTPEIDANNNSETSLLF
ncbi:uncharacterized protein LOC127860551 isoform X2 [Dreissena polymorpha]|uniref:Uncharacterized protein n=1 Tax=Dreissena polymorpha TaxID=45954 RepID=A0A9D3YFQ7_DREPO|nr:uncharacterized protein LOC127860551 isoform X2 [Dreissena polymorpha]KAH3699719.1 hypothetical protein DPMN_074679 [Dreissena polymorpha]